MIKNNGEITKGNLEAPGFEPGAFRMRSGHSTTELCPRIVNLAKFRIKPTFICCCMNPKTDELTPWLTKFNVFNQLNKYLKY